MKLLVVWYDSKKNLYYHRVVKKFGSSYEVGNINSYGHRIVDVVDIYKELVYRESLLKKVLSRVIGFLHKIYKKL